MTLLRKGLGWLALRAKAMPERGIQFQVAALSLSGVIVVGAICLFGLRLEANTQTTADTVGGARSQCLGVVGELPAGAPARHRVHAEAQGRHRRAARRDDADGQRQPRGDRGHRRGISGRRRDQGHQRPARHRQPLRHPLQQRGGGTAPGRAHRERRLAGQAARRGARGREAAERIRSAEAFGQDADDAPAREGLHAARRREVRRRPEEARGRVQGGDEGGRRRRRRARSAGEADRRLSARFPRLHARAIDAERGSGRSRAGLWPRPAAAGGAAHRVDGALRGGQGLRRDRAAERCWARSC